MEGLVEGRMVHYVMEAGRSKGEHRPAVIVRVWGDPKTNTTGYVNLMVFTDFTNDGEEYQNGVAWKTSRVYSENKEPGSWHWIEQA